MGGIAYRILEKEQQFQELEPCPLFGLHGGPGEQSWLLVDVAFAYSNILKVKLLSHA